MNKTHFSIKFFQKKKKKKKESTDAKWRVSKKQVFFKNTTTPIRPMEIGFYGLVDKLF
jgi:hypothetical protein